MPLKRRAPPMSLPMLSQRARPREPFLIEAPELREKSMGDIYVRLRELRRDLRQSEEALHHYWALLLDYLIETAADTLIDGASPKLDAPPLRHQRGDRPAFGGHRLPPRNRTMIRAVQPRPEPVSTSDILEGIELIRDNLRLRLMQTVKEEKERAERMAELLGVYGGRE
jgi:hypothetical protein